jgi:hypothetical protein
MVRVARRLRAKKHAGHDSSRLEEADAQALFSSAATGTHRSNAKSNHQAGILALSRSPSLFDRLRSADLLQFWLVMAARFLIRGGPTHRDVLATLVPYMSLSLSLLNRIMMAPSLTHWSLTQAHSAHRTENERLALVHYTAAISAMNTEEATTIEKLVAASLDWTIEGLQGNLSPGRIRLDGLHVLVEDGDEADLKVRKRFRPFLDHARAVNDGLWAKVHFTSNINAREDDVSEIGVGRDLDSRRTERSYAWIISHIVASRSRLPHSATHPEARSTMVLASGCKVVWSSVH